MIILWIVLGALAIFLFVLFVRTILFHPKNEIEQADEDIRMGRVYKAESVDDMFNQILGEGNW